VKKQQQKSGGSQITCNVGADVNVKIVDQLQSKLAAVVSE